MRYTTVTFILRPVIFGLLLSTVLITPRAVAFQQCIDKGKISYSDRGCPPDASARRFQNKVTGPSDPAAAQARHEANVAQLRHLQQQRLQQERQHQRWLRHQQAEAQRRQLAARRHTQKCQRLAMNARTADRELALVTRRGHGRALLRSQHAHERLAFYCGR